MGVRSAGGEARAAASSRGVERKRALLERESGAAEPTRLQEKAA